MWAVCPWLFVCDCYAVFPFVGVVSCCLDPHLVWPVASVQVFTWPCQASWAPMLGLEESVFLYIPPGETVCGTIWMT